MTDKLFRIIEENEEEYKHFLRDIVLLESYSYDKADVDALADFIKSFAENKGLTVTVKPFEKAGNGLLITMNENAPLPPVVLSAHMDTVHPRGTFAKPVFREENGAFYGPGVSDDKGGVAIGMLVMDALKSAGYTKRPVKFILASDEEIRELLSGKAGKDHFYNNARGAAAAFNLENGDGNLCVARKGFIRYNVTVTGKAANTSVGYAEGVSAVKEAAHKIIEIEKLSDPNGIVYNCSLVSGGEKDSFVPAAAEFTVFIRYARVKEFAEIKRNMESIINRPFVKGSSSVLEITGERPPMEDTPANRALASHIIETAKKYGLGELTAYTSAIGSNSSYLSFAGVPTVCAAGPIGDYGHTVKEMMYADSLVTRAKLTAAAVCELPDGFNI